MLRERRAAARQVAPGVTPTIGMTSRSPRHSATPTASPSTCCERCLSEAGFGGDVAKSRRRITSRQSRDSSIASSPRWDPQTSVLRSQASDSRPRHAEWVDVPTSTSPASPMQRAIPGAVGSTSPRQTSSSVAVRTAFMAPLTQRAGLLRPSIRDYSRLRLSCPADGAAISAGCRSRGPTLVSECGFCYH